MALPQLFSIGEMAKIFHLSVSSLHHYEALGSVSSRRNMSIRRRTTATTASASSSRSTPSGICARWTCHSPRSLIFCKTATWR